VEEIKQINRETSERLLNTLTEENKTLQSKLLQADHKQVSLQTELRQVHEDLVRMNQEKTEELNRVKADVMLKNAELLNLGARFEVNLVSLLLSLSLSLSFSLSFSLSLSLSLSLILSHSLFLSFLFLSHLFYTLGLNFSLFLSLSLSLSLNRSE
jgi:hypothetical protein